MKSRLRLVPLLLMVVVVGLSVAVGERRVRARPATLVTGDIVFHRSRSSQGRAIALATGSAYTHMGLVVLRRDGTYVLEAVGPVRLTPFAAWTARGENGEVVVKRLRGERLTEADRARMMRVGRRWLGRPYDTRFEWSDARIYCSELVYKVYERGAGVTLGRLQRAGDFALGSAEVRRLISRRFPARSRPFDPEEPVVSPASILADPALETVTGL